MAKAFNLHLDIRKRKAGKDCVSLQKGKAPRSIETSITAHGVELCHPRLTNKQFRECLAGTGPRKVFANFKADRVVIGPVEVPTEAKRIHFDPTLGDRFFHFFIPGTPANAAFGGKPGQFKVDRCSAIFIKQNGDTYGIS